MNRQGRGDGAEPSVGRLCPHSPERQDAEAGLMTDSRAEAAETHVPRRGRPGPTHPLACRAPERPGGARGGRGRERGGRRGEAADTYVGTSAHPKGPASVLNEARSSSGPGDRRAEAGDMNATPGDKVLRGESPSPSPAWFSDRWRPGQPEAPGSRPVGRSLENREHLQAPASRGAECRTLPARRGCLRQAPRPPPRGKQRRAAWGG